MKTFLVFGLAVLAVFRASAQVDVELSLDQEQFLPSESVPLTVKITNRSGQQLHLGVEPDWLTFSVESTDGFVVIKNAEVPVEGEFDLETSQVATKHVDLQPYFSMTKPGRYKVIATLRIKDWAAQVASLPERFDVISGALLWQQDFGVPDGTNAAPEVRKYTLEKANYLREQLRLYVQVSDAALSRVYKVSALGPMVSFSRPEAQVDRMSRLNVLWQTGAVGFSYAIVNPNGTIEQQDTYDNYYSRPRLMVDENGGVVVVGGTKRPKAYEMPVVVAPNQLPQVIPPAPTTNPPAKMKK
ncbi:MAG TPA: hypothetical protein VL863_07120 [bacterium]|nr:hypothetical protein [bacterium]